MTDAARPLKILAVDPDEAQQKRYRAIFGEIPDHEFIVVPADDGGMGLSLAQTFGPDCILVSTALPDMGGGDFVARLGRPAAAEAPAVVMVAAPGGEGEALAAMGAGAEDFLAADGLGREQVERALLNATRIVALRAELDATRREISAMGFDDPLTSLATRSLFHNRLTHAVILAKRNNQNVAVMLIELTVLKEINYLAGNEAGDAALREVAHRLKRTLREADTVARVSGNQFGVILETGATYDGAIITAEKIQKAMAEPGPHEEGPVDLTLDIGVALFPNHGEDGNTLLYHAEAAMAQARREGGGFAVFAYDEMPVELVEDGSSAA